MPYQVSICDKYALLSLYVREMYVYVEFQCNANTIVVLKIKPRGVCSVPPGCCLFLKFDVYVQK